MFKIAILSGALALSLFHVSSAAATEIPESVIQHVQEIAENPAIALLAEAQYETTKEYSQSKTDELDQLWRRERELENQPLVARVFGSPGSVYLTYMQAQSAGLIVEMFATDAVGLNIAVSAVTSDYWQGDEEKFQAVASSKDVWIGPAEMHEGTATERKQVSVPIYDDEGEMVGVLVADINMTEVRRRIEAGVME